MKADNFATRVLAWYDVHGRKNLPWQHAPSLYKTWVSEIMLQQTQVVTVIPYFNRFLSRFPTVVDLANADEDEVLHLWAGLGYYARARNLHKTARIIRDDHDGVFPTEFEQVLSLSGIGRSTAGAILSLALDQRHAMLDGNVKRVLARHQEIAGHPSQKVTENALWEIAEANTPSQSNRHYTQAMMDLGALICTRTRPKCDQCPVFQDCQARQNDTVHLYPQKKPKKANPVRHTLMAIVTCGELVLLQKRPSSGLWGGLYVLPMFDDEKELVAAVGQTGHAWDAFVHKFTHFSLHISPQRVVIDSRHNLRKTMCKDGVGYEWHTRAQIAVLGLPKPVQTLMTRLDTP